ncbi:MAG: gamma-glutamyltranspeptidase/glutathione hydrolase [Saprospiraceae bacterium]|jgi:gamma-glutamyltranspeptidase/glutathione hydrolase
MNYALSGGHKKTIEAAEIILNQGGNAVDAAIAGYLVSFVAEPCMASLGAGGFAMINNKKQIKVIDFFCQTPIQKKSIHQQDFFPVTVDFGRTTEDFHVGKGSIAVPGALAGIYKMHELYGSIPIKQLIEPALLWSKEGIPIDKFQAYDFILLAEIFALDPNMKHVFFNKNGTLKKEGDILRMESYSDFLDVLSHEGRDLFYKGDIAKSISNDMLQGGHLTRNDFDQYEAIVRDPIKFNFLGKSVHTTGFPSVGGMLVTAILNTFQDSTSDKKIYPQTIEHFQELASTFSRIAQLNNDQAKIANYLFHNFGINTRTNTNTSSSKWGGTSHFNVIDKKGMTVSLTTSVGEGSGYFIPGTDMQMNNMLGEEALMPNGFHNWIENQRLQSMMCPTILTDESGSTLHALGSGGAGRIPYAISQVLINSQYFNSSIEQSISTPRLHINNSTFEVEKGFDIENMDIPNLNIWENQSLYFGGINAVSKTGNSYIGTADKRRYGSFING